MHHPEQHIDQKYVASFQEETQDLLSKKIEIKKILKQVIRFSLSRCKWTSQKQKQMRNTSFSERLRRSNLYLNFACKSRFSISLWPVFIAYYSCYHPKKNLSLLSRLLVVYYYKTRIFSFVSRPHSRSSFERTGSSIRTWRRREQERACFSIGWYADEW